MIYLDDLLAATGGRVHGPVFATTFVDFCYDTRLLNPGELFLAVATEKGDGHDYVLDAARGGAAGVLCQRPLDLEAYGVTCIVIDDTRQALVDWARFVLHKLNPTVVGITGSSGKTTTKEITAAVLARHHTVLSNFGNYNDRYGLPIALGRLEPKHEVAVLEMACDGVDEIRELAALTRPRIGVVTSVNETHMAYLGSLETIAAEKGRLVEALPAASAGGVAILNYDDERVRAMAARTRARLVTYGTDPDADLVAGSVAANPSGVSFTVFVKEFFPVPGLRGKRKLRVRLPLLGAHSVYAALAAVAVGLVLDVPLEEALGVLAAVQPLPGRLNPLAGVNDTRILDDSFNASAASTLVALETLALFDKGRRIALLGDLLEHPSEVAPKPGSFDAIASRQIGQRTAQVADLLVAQGDGARHIAAEARAAGLASDRILVTYTSDDTLRGLRSRLAPGDTVLIKGSVESRMEDVVAGLMAHPDQAESRLVRQTTGWRKVRLLRPGRPTWLEVDLEAIAHNVRRIAGMVGPASRVLAVLKADAYGHGAVRVARTALNNGAKYLGVASINEGAILRQAGIAAPVLVLGFTPAWQARELVLNDLAATVFDLDVARALSRAARELNRKVRVHVKVDTGMGRLGLLPDQVLPFVHELQMLPDLILEGIFTHFSVADSSPEYTQWQAGRFRQVLAGLEEAGIEFPLVHAANSAAILALPGSHFTMVRLGIAMYGLDPSSQVRCPPDFRPALAFKTQVAQVKTLPPGSFVSYGNAYQTTDVQQIAVIPVGYADGFRRAPNHWGHVLVRGQRAPIVGRVCMDQTMIEVSHIPGVRQGDEVVLIGEQGKDRITAEDVAERLGTINYEVVSEILARVPRVV
ncbi:MAG: alanine racemase [Anaerolineae bacterium]|nr:alanine racemase [Anaerolineae bacterium]